MFQTLNYKASNVAVKQSPTFDSTGQDDVSSPGPGGGTRRPGNLWTAEARDDMFRRRENGETWETICKDYPKRSRHAMQQQYSMMKKQKAIANGTWTNNRRGRKRRVVAPETWPARVKGQERWEAPDQEDEMTDDDEFGESDDGEDADSSEQRPSYHDESATNGRPPGLMRSITEPTKATKPRTVSFPPNAPANGQTQATISNGTTSIPDHTSVPYNNPPYNGSNLPRKRQRLHEISAPAEFTSNAGPYPTFAPVSVILDRDEFLQLLEIGTDRARQSNKAIEEWKASQNKASDLAVRRANARASDAIDIISARNYEHGDAMKQARSEFTETLKGKSREHADEIRKLKEDLQSQHLSQVSSLERRIEDLQLEIEAFRAGRPERERELELEKNEMEARLKGQEKIIEAASKSEFQQRLPPIQESASPSIHNGDQPHSPPDAELPEGHSLADTVDHAIKSTHTRLDALAGMLVNLEKNLPEMTHKRIVNSLKDINKEKTVVSEKFGHLRPLWERLLGTLSSLKLNPSEDTIMKDAPTSAAVQEAPRTPPEEHHEPVKADTNGAGNYPGLPHKTVPEEVI